MWAYAALLIAFQFIFDILFQVRAQVTSQKNVALAA